MHWIGFSALRHYLFLACMQPRRHGLVSWSSHSDLIDLKWASSARVKYEVPLCGGIAPRMADYRACTGDFYDMTIR